MVVSLAMIGAWTFKFGPGALLYIPHHWPQLVSAAAVWSTFLVRPRPATSLRRQTELLTHMAHGQATFVFFQSYIGEQMLALGGNTSNAFYNASLAPSLPFFARSDSS